MARRYLAASAIAALAIASGLALKQGGQPAHARPAHATCGTERWAVKTLSDPGARRVNFHARSMTVSALRRLIPTGTYMRGRGPERMTYTIRARLIATKYEDDGDFHLVIADPHHRSRRMIVEFPASGCTRHSLKHAQMRRARTALIRACGYPPSSFFRRLRGKATITGVGFFDFNHGQRGIAPNAIELHPVLRFTRPRCS